jgi:Tfp pilus assembly protein PilO
MISRNQKSIIFSSGLFVFTIIFALFFFKPFTKKFMATSKMMKKVTQDRIIVTSTVNSIPQMRLEKMKQEEELIKLSRRLPSEDKIPAIISQISDKTSELKVTVLSITAGDKYDLEGKPVMAKPIFIDLMTDIKTLSEYLSMIEEIETAVAVKNVFVMPKPGLEPPDLSVRIQVETYISKG